MSNLLIHFLLGMAVSFAGSLPPGVISITVVDTAVRKSFRDSMVVAGAAAFIEFFQSFIAILFSKVILKNEAVGVFIQYGAAPVFLLLGIFFLTKDRVFPKREIGESRAATSLAKGLLVGALNMFVIPFWIFWSSYFAANNWIDLEYGTIAIFSAGITAGAMLAFLLYAKVGLKLANKTTLMAYWGSKSLGLAFLAFSLYQFVKLLRS